MGKQFDDKVTWVIHNFSSLQSAEINSVQFFVGGCKWYLKAYPKENKADFLSLYLQVPDYESLPSGWRRHARFSVTMVNQNSEKSCQLIRESQKWFEVKSPNWGRPSGLPLDEIHAKDSGFLVNGELKILAEIEVLEVIGKLDVSVETSTLIQTMDVNGFQLLPSQANSVRRMFERHPDIASEFRPKNINLRIGYMSLLLNLIETMCQSPHELSKDDLSDSFAAMGSMKDVGFKLDWLEKKLDQVSEKKDKKVFSETRLKEMEDELKDLKQKCSDMAALVEQEKGEVSAAKASFSFDDVV